MFVDSNKIIDLLPYYKKKLSGHYDEKEIENIFYHMTFFVFGWSKFELRFSDQRISESELLNQRKIVQRLLEFEPIQHIVGKVEFYNCFLSVNKHTLVPRPETEELVDLIVQNHQDEKCNILDIGTGSGCIPIAIGKVKKNWNIFAVDISSNALQLAKQNAKENKVHIEFAEMDILHSDFNFSSSFDIIVSNPPYVLHTDKKNMHANVLNFDPHTALFVEDENPLKFYKSIIDYALKHLVNNGWIYFEIHEAFGIEMVNLLSAKGFKNIQIIQDLQNKDRMISAQK